jgi:hypothetical protein
MFMSNALFWSFIPLTFSALFWARKCLGFSEVAQYSHFLFQQTFEDIYGVMFIQSCVLISGIPYSAKGWTHSCLHVVLQPFCISRCVRNVCSQELAPIMQFNWVSKNTSSHHKTGFRICVVRSLYNEARFFSLLWLKGSKMEPVDDEVFQRRTELWGKHPLQAILC